MTKVLLVDDDVDLVDMNKAVLTSKGFGVETAYTAAEGREALARSVPDLMVVDVMMETQTAGFDLARDAHAKYPKLPILMLTGVREATGVPFKFEPDETWLPVVEFLEKPFAPAALAAKVKDILKD